MKVCPTCSRTYEDDTLRFCLDDGARLSDGARSTLGSDAEKTAVLPSGLRPTEQSPSPPRSTIQSAAPDYSPYEAARLPEKRGGGLWIIISGLLALIVVGLVAVVGLFAWKANQESNSHSSNVLVTTPTPSPTAGIRSVSTPTAKPTLTPLPTVTPDLNWMDGVWGGVAYQTDTKTTWAVRLTVRNGTYLIDYPDIPCNGSWKMIDKNSRQASFTEVITQGLERCVNNSHVTIERLGESEISVRYSHPGRRDVIATVTLSRR